MQANVLIIGLSGPTVEVEENPCLLPIHPISPLPPRGPIRLANLRWISRAPQPGATCCEAGPVFWRRAFWTLLPLCVLQALLVVVRKLRRGACASGLGDSASYKDASGIRSYVTKLVKCANCCMRQQTFHLAWQQGSQGLQYAGYSPRSCFKGLTLYKRQAGDRPVADAVLTDVNKAVLATRLFAVDRPGVLSPLFVLCKCHVIVCNGMYVM
ncbi:hypothetical protein AWB69_01199 [Caballeronia udeis]|uniref:Uncharacterized protein n=1 Tax=Caballeronia udeis TaxID=1232866 RepID=A0A158FJ86_9BURK|nr:hypothetical protein AWB69_01199 [Caballeronia udeis]